MSTKQRMISAADLAHLEPVPEPARSTALWLWLNLDPLGRGPMSPEWIAQQMRTEPATVLDHLVMLLDADFLTTYWAESSEWILLLHPLKADLRRTKIDTPEPPRDRPWTSMAMGVGERERARARARERVRAEDAARADAWDAVRGRADEDAEEPERPLLLDAPPMFCDDHMPHGAGRKKCGPCRDARLLRDEWVTRRVYEEKLARHYEATGADDEPF